MSHELRTPLNAVIGFSEIMLAEMLGPLGAPRYSEYIGDIHDSGAHLLSLINDILDISRFDAGEAELVEEDLRIRAMEIADADVMERSGAERRGDPAPRTARRTCRLLQADKRRIRQILLNLLVQRAQIHTGRRDGAGVRGRCTGRRAGDCSVPTLASASRRKTCSKALEPFGQVDSSLARKYEGTGLGLPLTRQMAELHGGSLTLESTPGQGTTVTVILPAWRLVPRQRPSAA